MSVERAQHKMPILFNVDEHVYSEVVDEIDRLNWLRLGRNSTTRGGLLLFAMALGWRNGLKVDLKKVHSGGFARRESFSPDVPVVINAVHFADLGYENIDELRYIDDAYDVCEKYVNGGFGLIEGEMNRGVTTEEFTAELIEEMDLLHAKWFEDNN